MTPEVHIYSDSNFGQPRGNLEDDIDDRFGDEAEVCGGGQWLDRTGWNIDIELLDEDADVANFAKKLVKFLKKWGVPKDTYLRLFESDWVEGQEPRRVNVFGESSEP